MPLVEPASQPNFLPSTGMLRGPTLPARDQLSHAVSCSHCALSYPIPSHPILSYPIPSMHCCCLQPPAACVAPRVRGEPAAGCFGGCRALLADLDGVDSLFALQSCKLTAWEVIIGYRAALLARPCYQIQLISRSNRWK
mgnify:CR=1 FL=1